MLSLQHKWISYSALFFFVASSSAIPESGPDFTFHARVEEVRLTFLALDRHNRHVTSLLPSELAVVDNDLVVRDFRSFAPTAEARLDVIILVDDTASIAPRRRQEIAGLEQLVNSIDWQPDDRVSIAVFGRESRVACLHDCPASASPALLTAASADARLTPLYDTALDAIRVLASDRDPLVRTVLIILSDGNDNYSRSSITELVYEAGRSDTSIYTIDLSPAPSQGTVNLQRLANATGGAYLSIDEGFLPVVQSVVRDLRASYTLSYVPPRPIDGPHSIRIMPTTDLDLTFRSRTSYLYGRSAGREGDLQ